MSAIVIGSFVQYQGKKWLVTDTHGYPVTTVDLRHNVIVDPKRRFKDEAETKRNIPVSHIVTE
jgi:hypothetical protein